MAKKKRQFNQNEIQEIAKSYQAGESIASISERYGYATGSRSVIRKILQDAGISLRTYRLRKDTVKKGKKLCRICNKWVELKFFYKRTWKGKPSTEFSYCKFCNKTVNERTYVSRCAKRYGLSVDDYNSLLEKQGNKCAICKCPQPNEGKLSKRNRLVIDHDHLTGRVRGLLCDPCNRAIGQFKENLSNIKAAVKYLEENVG